MTGSTSIEFRNSSRAWLRGALYWVVSNSWVILFFCFVLEPANVDAMVQPGSDIQLSESTLETSSDSVEIRKRVQTIAWCCGGFLGLIIIALGYFRLNHATRGIYSRRLLSFAILVSLLLAIVCVVSLIFVWR